MTIPRVRVRTRPVAEPQPRVRLRPVELPPARKRTLAAYPADMPPDEVCRIGEIQFPHDASTWSGWPNGSLVMARMGARTWQKGRHIPIIGGGFHILRWLPTKATYQYVRKVRTHAEALNAL